MGGLSPEWVEQEARKRIYLNYIDHADTGLSEHIKYMYP